jgi:hypothetical protein
MLFTTTAPISAAAQMKRNVSITGAAGEVWRTSIT